MFLAAVDLGRFLSEVVLKIYAKAEVWKSLIFHLQNSSASPKEAGQFLRLPSKERRNFSGGDKSPQSFNSKKTVNYADFWEEKQKERQGT
jgi:hypothetical protein